MGHGELKRLVTGGAGLIFKGSGFYITDYARKNTKDAALTPKLKSKPDSGAAATEAKAVKPEKSNADGNRKS